MQIGILGGTFNPIHNGHLLIAAEVCRVCKLDQVWFMPACEPPHKDLADAVPFAERLAMVELAIQSNPQFIVSDLEGQRGGRSYSIQTLEELRQRYPADDFTFIMGLDSFTEIGLWKSYARLFDLCHIAVAARPHFDGDLQQLLPVAMAGRFCYDADAQKLNCQSGFTVQLITQTAVDISSTEIRRRVAEGLPVSELIPATVADYIRKHHLYRQSSVG